MATPQEILDYCVDKMARHAIPRYVEFVARTLPDLRADVRRRTVDEPSAQALYPEVLTDVALRWTWLELARLALRRRGAG